MVAQKRQRCGNAESPRLDKPVFGQRGGVGVGRGGPRPLPGVVHTASAAFPAGSDCTRVPRVSDHKACRTVDSPLTTPSASVREIPPCLLEGGGGLPPPPPFQGARPAPSLRPTTVPLMASAGFVTDSNRLQPLWQPPPTACLTASGGASECGARGGVHTDIGG